MFKRRVAPAPHAQPVQTYNPSRGLRRWLAALSFVGCLAGPAAAADDEPARVASSKSEAVLVGSSSFNQSFGRLIARDVA